MLIIPTEKRFDWQHTPVVLFSIVLLNVMVFLFYQSSDDVKFTWAVENYQNENFLEVEWPFFQRYLRDKRQDALLKDYQWLYNEDRYDELIVQLLMHRGFYHYLRFDQYEYFQSVGVDGWFSKREKIAQKIQSTSLFSHGLIPIDVTFSSLISYQFLHADIMHLLGNLFFLIVCGFAVEAAIGRWRFLLFYLLTGAAGGLLHALFNPDGHLPLIGASAAVSGVMAMYLGIFQLKKIEFFYWLFVFVGYFRAPALTILPLYIGKELFQFYNNAGSNVAFMSHAGGFIMGGFLVLVSRLINPEVFNQQYIEEDQETDPFQEDLANVYQLIEKYRFQGAYKAVSTMIAKYGLSFELALLRYQLVKFDKGSAYQKAFVELLKVNKLTMLEVSKMAAVWVENAELQQLLDDDTTITVGMHLSTLADPNLAEVICDRLVDSGCSLPSLGVLSRKLSIIFGQHKQPNKQQKFEKIAEKLLGHAS